MEDVVVIGGGPCGLSAAVALQERGINCVVLEKGAIVNSILSFPSNIRLYSTSDRLEVGGVPFLSAEDRPLRDEVMRYYRSVVARLQVQVKTFHKVTELLRADDLFVVRCVNHNGRVVEFKAKAIVLATGTYDQPRKLNVPGEQLPKVMHYYKEGHSYAGQRVLVVGGKNSAIESAIDLYRNGADVTLVHRGESVLQGIKPTLLLDIRNMIEKQRIRFFPQTSVIRIDEDYVYLESPNGPVQIENDFVFSLIGYQPDAALLQSLDIHLDDQMVPLFNPDTYETNIPNVFVAGVVTGGITNKVFIDDGRLHGPKIADAIKSRLN